MVRTRKNGSYIQSRTQNVASFKTSDSAKEKMKALKMLGMGERIS